MKLTLLICSLWLFPIAAHAEESLNTFLKQYDAADPERKSCMRDSIVSAGNSMLWANTLIEGWIKEGRKQEPLYCPPPKLPLTTEQVLDILRKEVKEVPGIGESPWGLALIISLHTAFPCH
jgi:hypothetical protein